MQRAVQDAIPRMKEDKFSNERLIEETQEKDRLAAASKTSNLQDLPKGGLHLVVRRWAP